MLYVGLDIHLKQISVCVLDENGKRLRRERVAPPFVWGSRSLDTEAANSHIQGKYPTISGRLFR